MNLKAPVAGGGMSGRASTAKSNPFLDEGWLLQSWEDEVDLFVNGDGPDAVVKLSGGEFVVGSVQGGTEEYVMTRGKNAGGTATRYTGEVKDIVYLLNQAAQKLDIGVRIRVYPAVSAANGRPLKDRSVVHYMAKERTERTRSGDTEDTEDNE